MLVYIAEFIGTCLLISLGDGVVANVTLNKSGMKGAGSIQITFAWGLAVMLPAFIFGASSGAHFNPAVTLVMALRRQLPWNEFFAYVVVQVVGAIAGVLLAHVMFALPIVTLSATDRSGTAKIVSEVVATFGLITVILGCVQQRKEAVPYVVAAYIGSAYWFTASTSFANPAVTIARSLSNTFSGIRIADVPAFIIAQLIGALLAMALYNWLYPPVTE